MTTKRRAYGEIRKIIEDRGGAMVYEREGHRYGAWVISLNGKSRIVEATGAKSFPLLDKLYKRKPGVPHPTQWDHYLHELRDSAVKELLAVLK
ncbi:MAG: hypothetical protein EXR98_17315 [Gemmataceae bacterium]|nr:hypothetical protein [Gemmataceae bacterium]